jgi:Kef-type K+ transport system membrane component KefB
MKLHAHEITHFIFLVAFLLLFARGLGELARYFRQPGIFGEILGGVILGPSVFGYFFPAQYAFIFQSSPSVSIALDGLVQLALIMLLLVSGLEVDMGMLVRQGKSTLATAMGSFTVPFVAGFLLAWYTPGLLGRSGSTNPTVFALFMGIAFSITALPVVARTLFDLGIFKSPAGVTIISSAMLIDFLGWLIFSVVLGMIGAGGQGEKVPQIIMIVVLFTAGLLFIGRRVFHYVIPFIQSRLSYPGAILNFILISGLLAAAFTEFIGIHAIFGAFIVGVALGDSVHLRQETREIIHQFVANVFAPLFFISIGLRVDFIRNFNLPLLLIFLAVAFITKIAGTYAGAKGSGYSKEDSLLISFGMNSRGAMEIAIGIVALENKVISSEVFVVLVIMAILTSLSSSPLMSKMMKRSRSFIKPHFLLDGKLCCITKAGTAEAAIRELSALAAVEANLPADGLDPGAVHHLSWH